jgi:hypothetical protein
VREGEEGIMRLSRAVAGTAGRIGGLFALLVTGCMPIGYAYPTVSYIRPASVGPARDEVKAFRLDVADEDNCLDLPEKDRYVLTPLPLHRDGSFDPQMKVAVDYGWLWNCVAFIYDSSRHHTIMVRLYRPGYHTIEMESWRKEGRMQWTPAPSPEEREQAIDDLVSTWRTSPARLQNKYASQGFVPPRESIVFRYLAPGSTANGHRTALAFAAGEYERLANDVTEKDLHARLEDKAKELRQLANR